MVNKKIIPKTPSKKSHKTSEANTFTPHRTQHRSQHRTLHGNATKRTLSYADQLKRNERNVRQHTPRNENKTQTNCGGTPSVDTSRHSLVSRSLFIHSDSSQNFSFISDEINSLFGMSMFDLMKIINDFVPQYKKCNDKAKKQMMLLQFMMSFP